MELYTLIYLFNKLYIKKIDNENLKNNVYIKMAYNKVIKILLEHFSETELITINKINKLNITDNMKNKLYNLIKTNIKKSDELKIKKYRLFNQLSRIDGLGKKKHMN